jgi:hypothetical protein
MNTLAVLAQSSASSTDWSLMAFAGLMGAMVVVLGISRLLSRMLSVVSHLLVSAGAAVAGLATVLTMGTVLAAVFMVVVNK